jgi:polysaccharide biosynthesis protein PslG
MILAVTGVLAATTAGPAAPRADRPRSPGPSKCITDGPKAPGGGWNFREFRTLGVRVWTSGISWANIAPTRPADPRSPTDPAYVWPADLDTALNKARAYGIEPVLYVNGFPGWSNGGRDPSWVSTNPADYGDFMAAAVARYPQVRRWIAFSEPSHILNFRPQGDGGRRAPRLYAQLLDAAYRAMHAVRQDVVVIGGNVHPAGKNDEETTAPDTFLRNMVLPNGRRPRLDMFGINPYTERQLDMKLPHRAGRVDLNDVDWLGRKLDRYYPGRHLQIFVEEFGWNTEHAARGWLYIVSRKKQAARLSIAYKMASRLPRINTMCWFQLYDAPPDKSGTTWLNWTSGLRTVRGARKPAWWSFARVPRGPSRLP